MKEIIERLKDFDKNDIDNFFQFILSTFHEKTVFSIHTCAEYAKIITDELCKQINKANKVKRIVIKDKNFPLNFGEKVKLNNYDCVVECVDFSKQEVVFANTDGLRFIVKMCDINVLNENN